jgi:hypothetical protein
MRRLSVFGVEIAEDRGKGSELVLIAPNRKPGVITTIKDRRQKGPYSVKVIGRILYKFGITKDEFWVDLRELKKLEKRARDTTN